MTSSSPLGGSTSPIEVANISSGGVWRFPHGEAFFMPCCDFPWFKDVSVGVIINLEAPVPRHLNWPDLDADLENETLRRPETFPLKRSAQPPHAANAPESHQNCYAILSFEWRAADADCCTAREDRRPDRFSPSRALR
jgi:hypothetical protein